MNIYITGGHLTPALAIIDRLRKYNPDVTIYFIGREFAQTHPPVKSHEQDEIEKRDIKFFSITAAKYHRQDFWRNIFEFLKFPVSVTQIFRLFYKNKPDVVLSFGGYVAFPVCLIGKIYGARIIIHEQTKSAGLANQVSSYIADKIAVANEESVQFFPKHKTVVTGNPIRESLFREYSVPPEWIPKIAQIKPLIYITGGSQGSQIINRTVSLIISKLVREFVVIHQCGTSTNHEYLKDLESVRLTLPTELQGSYVVREWIEAKEISYLMQHAWIVISRGGANTVEELLLSASPTIFIPLAFAYNDEQYKNIVPLVKSGSCEYILQKDLLPDTLYSMILKVDRNRDAMKKKALVQKELSIKDGSKSLIKLVLSA